MHSVLLTAVLLGADPSPPKLAMPGLSVIGIEAQYAEFLGEHLAQQLTFEGLDVVTTKEIASLLGIERQKQLLGCGETASSCIAELASALGADGVLMGDVAKVGGKTQINLKIISARDGTTLAAFSDRVEGEEAVLDGLTRASAQLAEGTAKALKRTLVPVALSLRGGASTPPWWVPVVAGAVVAGTGVVLFLLGNADYARLVGATPTARIGLTEAASLRDGGALKQGLGVTLIGVGAAAIVGGGVWWLLGRTSGPALAVVPGGDGATLVVSGGFP